MNDEEKIDLVKTGVDAVVGIGISEIVSGIVTSNVPRGNVAQRFCVFGAKHVISAMASEKTKKYTDEKIDNAIKWWKENVNERREAVPEEG